MKFYMMTDLEGVSGVTDYESWDDNSHANWATRQRMHRLLVAEVNAAADALFEAGATEVIVNDGHGRGYTLDPEALDPRVQVIHGGSRPIWLPLLDETCDATLLIGAHAKAGTTQGIAYHTYSEDVQDWSVNGVSMGEMGFQALIAGTHNVPMIFVSGDHWACEEIKALIPNIVTAAVKKGLTWKCAVAYTPKVARQVIREGILNAVARMKTSKRVKPLKFKTPLVMIDRRYSAAFKDMKPSSRGVKPATIPGARKIDHSTRELRANTADELLSLVWGLGATFRSTPLPPRKP